MLWEALHRLSEHTTNLGTNVTKIVNNETGLPASTWQDKCTFGLVKTLTVAQGLTLYYIVRVAGDFVDFSAKIKDQAPTGSSAILDVLRSSNDGDSWNSIFLPNKQIILPAGGTKLVIAKDFAIKSVAVGDLLRIDCLQIGSTNPGKGIEVVGRFKAK